MTQSRIITPLLKQNGVFSEISFEDSIELIYNKINSIDKDRNLFFMGGNYANEEMYLFQKWIRAGVKSNAIASFEYLGRENVPIYDKNDLVPFAEIWGSSRIYSIGLPQNTNNEPSPFATLIQQFAPIPTYSFNCPHYLHIDSFYAFFRSLNYFIVSHQLAKGIYVNGLGKNYSAYLELLLKENFQSLLAINHLSTNDIATFVESLFKESNPVFIYWEETFPVAAMYELENLCMLMDIQSKQSSGFLGIKKSLNSQGLFDMGVFSHLAVGGRPLGKQQVEKMEQIWQTSVESKHIDVKNELLANSFEQVFIFGEDPYSTCNDPAIMDALHKMSFKMAHTNTMSPTALDADLIVPMSMPEESDGIYTDSTRAAHFSKMSIPTPLKMDNIKLLSLLGEKFNLPPLTSQSDIFLEYVSFFETGCKSAERHFFKTYL